MARHLKNNTTAKALIGILIAYAIVIPIIFLTGGVKLTERTPVDTSCTSHRPTLPQFAVEGYTPPPAQICRQK